MIVSKIEAQKKNKNRVSIYCDNEFAFGLQTETLLKNSISVGSQLTQQQIEQLILQSDQVDALSKATQYVSKGLKTKKQVKDFLLKKGYNPQIISLVVEKLTEYKLISDENYIKAYVSDHKAYGELKLKQELYQKGLSKSLIEEYFANNYEADLTYIQNLADKYLKNKERTAENIIKCKKHLLSKGFKYEDISALDWGNNESWD